MTTNLSDLPVQPAPPAGAAVLMAVRDSLDPSKRRVGLLDPASLTTARTNVLSYGADRSGSANASLAINAAITASNIAQVRVVYVPAGTYRIDTSVAGIIMAAGITLLGDGIGRTILQIDDSAGAATIGIYGSGDDIQLRGLTVRGRADVQRTPGPAHHVMFENGRGCSFVEVESRYSRVFGLFMSNVDDAEVTRCRIYRSQADGIAVWGSSNARITLNRIHGANDDAISAHSSDTDPAPVRSGLVIDCNVITESQGINVLGAKRTSITDNLLDRIMAYGVRVEADAGFRQGDTPLFGNIIRGNIINDVFQRSEPNPRNGRYAYMLLSTGPRHGTGGAPAPGWPAPGTAALVPPLGPDGTSGALYADATADAQVQTPGGAWFQVEGNILARTRPAITSWSQWGHDPTLWIGNGGDGSGFYAGGIPESALAYDGIHITGPLQRSRIAGNHIETRGAFAIAFTAAGIADHDHDGLVIESNQLRDFTQAGISFGAGAPSQQDIIVRDTTLDGDPRFASPARSQTAGVVDGGWAASGGPVGLNAPNLITTGGYLHNHFRNLAAPDTAGLGLRLGNVLHASADAVTGYAPTNRGIGHMPALDAGWIVVAEDCDPRSPTYGALLSQPGVSGGGGVTSVAGRSGAVTLAVGDVAGAQSAAQVSSAIAAAIAGYATSSSVDARITALINAAPAALDTLGEIAAQLANDESAASALTTTVAGKLSITTAQATYLTIANAAASYQPLLGYTPYNASNPSGFITAAGAPVQSVAGRSGAVTLAVEDVAGAQSASQVASAIASAVAGVSAGPPSVLAVTASGATSLAFGSGANTSVAVTLNAASALTVTGGAAGAECSAPAVLGGVCTRFGNHPGGNKSHLRPAWAASA